jgi:hypothetical protein
MRTEHEEQAAVIQWFDMQYKPLAGLLFAVPNAAKRNYALAAYMKKEGLRAGVSDLMLPVAKYGFNGLFIEMKSLSGKPTKEQALFMARVTEQGYMAALCKGADAAMGVLKSYLG